MPNFNNKNDRKLKKIKKIPVAGLINFTGNTTKQGLRPVPNKVKGK